MGKEIKTTAISALSAAIDATGLVTEGAQEEALEAKRILAEEQIRNLRKLYYIDGTITAEELEAGIREIRQETQDNTIAVEFDSDMDILS